MTKQRQPGLPQRVVLARPVSAAAPPQRRGLPPQGQWLWDRCGGAQVVIRSPVMMPIMRFGLGFDAAVKRIRLIPQKVHSP